MFFEDFLTRDPSDLYPALIIPSPALFTQRPVNIFPNKLAPIVPNNIPRNPDFSSCTSF